MTEDIRCPKCGSDATYRYGSTPNGKRRFLCLVCGRQFVWPSAKAETAERPSCPKCGAPMHVYMRHAPVIRYRCRHYPKCRTFVKTDKSKKE
jgi:transposase-like protein